MRSASGLSSPSFPASWPISRRNIENAESSRDQPVRSPSWARCTGSTTSRPSNPTAAPSTSATAWARSEVLGTPGTGTAGPDGTVGSETSPERATPTASAGSANGTGPTADD